MTNYGDFYHCSVCGHVITILQEGNEDSLVCCGQKMERLEAKTADSSTEKHVPVVESNGDSIIVKVGSVPHPMTEEHYISFIEVVRKDGKRGIARTKGQDKAEAEFKMKADEVDRVYEYCNVHSLWADK